MRLEFLNWIAVFIFAAGASADWSSLSFYTDGQLVDWTSCQSNANNCNITCSFAIISNSSDVVIQWTNGTNDIDQAYQKNIETVGNEVLVSSITIDASAADNNYTCQSFNKTSEEIIASHTFIITGKQIAPHKYADFPGERFVTYDVDGSGSCNVTFACHVAANPQPETLWIRSFNEQGSVTVEFLNSTSFERVNLTDVYYFYLDISPYDDKAVGNYTCVSVNNMGHAVSPPVFPYIQPGLPELSQIQIPLDNSTFAVKLKCSSKGGFPAPKMSWEILINNVTVNDTIKFHSDYKPIDNGVSVLNFQMGSEVSNPNMTIRCHVSSDYENFTANADAGFIASNFSSIIYVKNCSSQDFSANGQCTLECKAYSPGELTAKWLYMSKPNMRLESSYPLSDFTVAEMPQNYFTTKLTLTDYRSGYYKCVLETQGFVMENVFRIANKGGQILNGMCLKSENCLAINAECYNNRCQCTGDFPVTMTDSDYSSACLPVASPENTTYCISDSQCNYNKSVENAYVCVNPGNNGVCYCKGEMHYIAETGTNECITKSNYYKKCTFDEQCQLSDEHLYCKQSETPYCDCSPGYIYTYYYQECYNPYGEYLTVSAALGISFGVILLICIIFVVIIIVSRSYKNRRAPNPRTSNNHRQQCNGNRPHVEWVNIDPAAIPYPVENPPSYVDLSRSETPPPSFEELYLNNIKFDDSSVLYFVNQNYDETNSSDSGSRNPTFEEDA